MSFQLVSKSVTLNDIERRNAVILRYFREFGSLRGTLRKIFEDIPKLLIQKCSPRCLVFSDISLTMILYRKAFRRGG